MPGLKLEFGPCVKLLCHEKSEENQRFKAPGAAQLLAPFGTKPQGHAKVEGDPGSGFICVIHGKPSEHCHGQLEASLKSGTAGINRRIEPKMLHLRTAVGDSA